MEVGEAESDLNVMKEKLKWIDQRVVFEYNEQRMKVSREKWLWI